MDNMYNKYALPHSSYIIYFSGNKGFHLGIDSRVLGIDGVYDSNLPKALKSLVFETSNGIKYIDSKIYNTTRIFRL